MRCARNICENAVGVIQSQKCVRAGLVIRQMLPISWTDSELVSPPPAMAARVKGPAPLPGPFFVAYPFKTKRPESPPPPRYNTSIAGEWAGQF